MTRLVQGLTRRQTIMGLAAPAILRTGARAATTKLRFLTSWFAEAEHGGFYQALATGLYAREGLDVSIDMGGPQVNGMQLLVSGAADLLMGYDLQTLNAVQNGLPVAVVASSFQHDLQGLMTHTDISGIAALAGDHKILISSAARSTFWPWLRQRFGFTDEQAVPYTFNLQPFLLDPQAAVQAYSTSEPFEARAMGAAINFFAFSDDGYPPYGNPVVTTHDMIARRPEQIEGFLRATMLGWHDYLRDPAPGNALIRQYNPKMTEARIAYSVEQIRKRDVIGGGDARTGGIGIITEARWQQTAEFLVRSRLLAPSTDWRAAFTTRFVDKLKILPV